jgi:hypothetical protein
MNKKRWLQLTGIIIVIVLVISLSSIKHGFRIVGYDPPLKNISVDVPYFDIEFNEPLSNANLSLYSPQTIISSYNVVNTYDIRVVLTTPVIAGQSDTVVIRSVEDSDGKIIKNLQFSFKPIYAKANTLTKAQSQYLLNQQAKSLAQVYGTTLVNMLPFYGFGNEFEVNYKTINDIPYITITAATSNADQDAQTWIAGQGYTVSTLNIKYIDQQP